MIILNLLNRIFGQRESLSRDDISSYQKKNTHSLEEKSLGNDFDSDALDGWSESSIPVENMNDLDTRFQSKFKTSVWSSSTLLFFTLFFLASGVILTFTYTSNNSQRKTTEDTESNDFYVSPIADSIDYVSNKKERGISQLKTISKEKEVQPSSLKRKITESKEQDSLPKQDIVEINQTISPDVKTKIPVQEKNTTLVFNLADEFYLHDFKLIDYRKFRNSPIKKRKLVPVGTPADQEYFDNEKNEDFVWKEEDIPYVEYLDLSMEYFEKSNYKKALKRFNIILTFYKDDINAHFYGGLCYYNLGQYQKAIEHFDDSYNIEFGNFRQEANWFKVKALIELGETLKAKVILDRIIAEEKFYSKEAKVLLNSLNKN